VKYWSRVFWVMVIACGFSIYGWGQSGPGSTSADSHTSVPQGKKKAEPGKEMGKGGEDVAAGAAKGAGDMAKGAAGAAGSLAHGSVGGAGASLGKGAGGLGKNVAVGTGKGVGKIGKGIFGEFKKLGGKSKNRDKKR